MKNESVYNPRVLMSAVLVAALAGTAQAGPRYDRGSAEVFHDRAKVVDVIPIREIVRVPSERRECWTEEVSRPRARGDAGVYALTGGLIGGIVGNQVGRGDGRKVATAAGSVIGAVIGHDIGRNRAGAGTDYVLEQRCQVVEEFYEEERLAGYDVTYRYRGREYTTRMDEAPGKFVKLRVRVDPVY
jgi:uncharacterized protein YcfJ